MRPAALLLLLSLALASLAPAREIGLAWDPNPEGNIVGYRIYWGAAPGEYSATLDVPAHPTEPGGTITGLPDAGTIFVSVVAVNSSGIRGPHLPEPLEVALDAPGGVNGLRIKITFDITP